MDKKIKNPENCDKSILNCLIVLYKDKTTIYF